MAPTNPLEIARLLTAHMQGTITPQEKELLDNWLQQSDDNRSFFEKLTSEDHILQRLAEYQELDLSSLKENTMKAVDAARPKRRRLYRLGVAAAAVVALAVAGIVYFTHSDKVYEPEILPGRKMAVLETSDGRHFILSQDNESIIDETAGSLIRNSSEGLEYVSESENAADSYHRIVVPCGGEYKVTLPDGSRVWLNSASDLKYMAGTSAPLREVSLTGEAYFEVVPSEKPFIVHMAGAAVRVLGTSFNISAYPDETFISTTLAEGSVEVSAENNSRPVIISPGEQARLSPDGSITVFEVDPSLYTGWKDSLFVFDKENLDAIMRKLSRWYNIDIVIESPQTNLGAFYGVMEKSEDIRTILDMMKKTYHIDYKITKDKIIITEL